MACLTNTVFHISTEPTMQQLYTVTQQLMQ